jgi:hypothetical protein
MLSELVKTVAEIYFINCLIIKTIDIKNGKIYIF